MVTRLSCQIYSTNISKHNTILSQGIFKNYKAAYQLRDHIYRNILLAVVISAILLLQTYLNFSKHLSC